MKVRASYRRLYEKHMSLAETVHRLRGLPKIPALLTLARIEAIIENAKGDYPKVAAEMIEAIPDCTLKRRYYRAYAGRDEVVPFDRLQILNAERIILTDPVDGPNEPDHMSLTNAELEELLKCLFALNDYINDWECINEREPVTWDISRLASVLARNMLFYATEDLAHLLGRYYHLYFTLPSELSSHKCHVDPADSFRKARGIDLEMFLSVVFGLAASAQIGSRSFYSNPSVYFSKTRLTNDLVQQALTMVSRTTQEFREALGELDLESSQPFNPYEVLVFRQTPVVRVSDGGVFPLSARFTAERGTQGVFWDIAEGTQGSRLFIFWGELVEEYCWRLFKGYSTAQPSLRGLYRERRYRRGKSEVKSSDIMFLYDDTLVLVEVNAGRLRVGTKQGGKSSDYEEDLRKKVLEGGIGQLSRVAADYRAGLPVLDGHKVDRVVPVLVTLEAFPWNAACVQHVRELAVRGRYCDREFADKWLIIDIEELERVAALGCQGISILDIIHGWQASLFRDQPLKNYLLHRFRGRNMKPALTQDGFHRMMKMIKSRLFRREALEAEQGLDQRVPVVDRMQNVPSSELHANIKNPPIDN